MIPCAVRAVFMVLIGLTPVSAAIAEVSCASGEFGVKQNAISIPHALARVFKTGKKTPSDYVGTAFVIDAKEGLLLTARHVVYEAIPGDFITDKDRLDLSFPNIDSCGRPRGLGPGRPPGSARSRARELARRPRRGGR